MKDFSEILKEECKLDEDTLIEASVELDYGGDDEFKDNKYIQKFIKKHKINAKIINPSGPAGGAPIILFTGKKKDLLKLMDDFWDIDDPDEWGIKITESISDKSKIKKLDEAKKFDITKLSTSQLQDIASKDYTDTKFFDSKYAGEKNNQHKYYVIFYDENADDEDAYGVSSFYVWASDAVGDFAGTPDVDNLATVNDAKKAMKKLK